MKSSKPTKYSQAVADYLVELRDSAATNMWGAGPYVARKFGMSPLEADQCLVYWMESFDE